MYATAQNCLTRRGILCAVESCALRLRRALGVRTGELPVNYIDGFLIQKKRVRK